MHGLTPHRCLLAAALLFTPLAPFAATPVLKFRVLLVEETVAENTDTRLIDIRLLNDENAGAASQKVKESAGVRDQIRETLVTSDYVRVIEDDDASSNADYIFRYKVGHDNPNPVLFASLTDARSQAVAYAESKQGETVAIAVKAIVDELVEFFLERNWVVRVKAVTNGKILVPRGELDGLRTGVELVGYSIDPSAADLPPDEQLLLAGAPAGRYAVAEVRDEAALLKPVGEAPLLKEGDMLEFAGLEFKRKQEHPNRDRDAWDRLYNK